MANINVNLVLHKSKTRKSDGRHPVVVRISKDRKYKDRFVKGYYYYVGEWNTKTNLPKGVSSAIKKKLSSEVTKYIEAEAKYDGLDVSLQTIIDEAGGNKDIAPSVMRYYNTIINRFTASKQIKTASSYKGAMDNLKAFIERDNQLSIEMRFAEISVAVLNRYKTWLDGAHERTFSSGKSTSYEIKDSTKHIYLRTLRSLYNKAIADGFASESIYPFKAFFKDLHFDMESDKKAITSDDINKISGLDLRGDAMKHEAQQYFIFGYYGMGINFVDMANLKWSDIKDGKILYRRNKLKRKKNTQKTFAIPVQGKIKEILDHYRPLTGINTDNYIFQVFDNRIHKTETDKQHRYDNVITRVNRDLKKIGVKAGIKKKISTYTWRHTAFSVLKLEKNIPIAMISQAAGHSSVAVTELYLDSFGNDEEQAIYGVL